MRVDIGAANAGIVLETQADACLACNLAHQTRVGFDLANVSRIGSLDAADVWSVRIVIGVDDRREVEADTKRAQLPEAGGEDRPLFLQRQQIELLRARRGGKTR